MCGKDTAYIRHISAVVRCSGDPLGCDKCVAISAECQYPARDTRRKKRIDSALSHESNASSNAGSSSEQATSMNHGVSSGAGAAGPRPPSKQHHQHRKEQQQQQQQQSWPYAESAGDTGCPSLGTAGMVTFDEWQESDRSAFLHPMPEGPLDPLGEGGKDGLGDHLMNDPFFRGDDAFNVYAASENFDHMSSSNSFPSPDDGLPPSWMISMDSRAGTADMDRRHSNSSSRSSNHVRHESYSRKFASGQTGWPDKGPGTPGQTSRILNPTSAPRGSQTNGSSAATPTTTTTPTSDGSSPGGSCRCLYLTARLLEDLGAKSAKSDPTSMDVQLGDFRDSLRQITAILECQKCLRRTENNMLLAMAGRYMSIICDQLVGCYVRLHEARGSEDGGPERFGWRTEPNSGAASAPPSSSSSTSSSSSSSGAWNEASGGAELEAGKMSSRPASDGRAAAAVVGAEAAAAADEMWFSTYRVEGSWEWLQVLTTLVTVQITGFCQVLAKLKTRAGSQRGQLELLVEAEERTQTARNRLRTSLDKMNVDMD
ncbi:hypothetical protein ACRALDRAFT_1066833 [Sodiomyces alcalophilus JCM 7366]|uniref:uncharacterized protein n=1 Tax=Sodiomyces alcalophilus JCM 7366 TaxID=591952 RepID=UPI0039B657AC